MPTITGSAGPDIIFGTSGNDTITGLGGADELNGGGGNDQYVDTLANFNGDRINAFAVGDHIIFTDASLATFNYSISGNTLTYNGGSLTLNVTSSGYLSATAITGGGVDMHIEARVGLDGDFNGDGRADILWRSDAGVVGNWLGQANGGFVVNDGAALRSVDLAWHIDGRGDFNGDGRDDIIWRNDNGQLGTWTGNTSGGFTINDGAALQSVPVSWHVVGTGDFNGDGKSDLLWRNDNGAMGTWSGTAASGFVINQSTVRVIDGSWHIVATGDFNGDRIADILWRNDNGLLGTWSGSASASGGFTINDGAALQTASGDWNIVGAADVNGDGRSDILWRNDDGTVADWLANASGGFIVNSASAQAVPVSWQLASVGDYNGDHRADLLWTNDNGALTDWLGQANGTFVENSANVPFNVGGAWHPQSEIELV